jgi:hypothetical protein
MAAVKDWQAELTSRFQKAFPDATELVVSAVSLENGKYKVKIRDAGLSSKPPLAAHRAVMKAAGLSSTDPDSEANQAVHALEIDL